MSDDPTQSIAGYLPPAISDSEQRLMISTELSVIRGLVAAGAFTVEAMQSLNHQLALPAALSPALAATSRLREVVVAELHAKLVAVTGIPLDYWSYPHRIDTPDDLAGLDG